MVSFDWKSVANHIYLIMSKPTNMEYMRKLRDVGIIDSGISSFVQYNLDKPWNELKHYKQEAIYRCIRNAYLNQYDKVIIIPDNVIFNASNFKPCFNELKDKLFGIINTGDVCEDCYIISKPVISYISRKGLDFSLDSWLSQINSLVSSNFVINKTAYPICYHPIDYIVSYVDGDDEEWKKDYEQYKLEGSESYNKANRWRANKTVFKYHIKNLFEYCPWINNIYLIVSSESQVPDFIDSRIKIIFHKDIIPKEYLPTFNSCTIEMFLGEIKSLSEYFIYANDDMITLTPLNKEDFFKDGKIVTRVKKFIPKGINYHYQCVNNCNLISEEIELKDNLILTHIPHPMLKSSYKHIWSIHENDIKSSITRFRKNNNYNQYIFCLYDYITKNYIETPLLYKFYKCEEDTNLFDVFLKHKGYGFICINDNTLKDIKIYYEDTGKISVIVPIYNSAEYLEKCLDSIIHQTWKNLEIILVNDGSTDKSLEICNEYSKKDSRIKVIDKSNSGVSDSRNVGIANSAGYWIGFVDSDDYIDFERYEKAITAGMANNCDLVKCDIKHVRIDGSTAVWTFPKGKYDIKDNIVLSTSKYDNSGVVPNLYRASIIRDNDIKFRHTDMSEDYMFNAEYFCACGNLYSINEPLYIYTRHPNTLSTSSIGTERYINMLKEFNILLKDLEKYPNFKYFKDTLIYNYYNLRSGIKGKRKNIIDLVMPYVDSSDINWIIEYNKYANNKIDADSNGVERFRSNDELFKYVFRGIEKYMPWIGCIHLLVMCDSQVPKWINRKLVHIVYHNEFIPKEYLPTFNSSTIEMFLKNVPGITNKFVYTNDDFYYTFDLLEKFYFAGNKIKSRLDGHPLNEKTVEDIPIWKRTFLNSYYLATEGEVREPNLKEENKYFVPPHIEQGLTKDIITEVWNKYSKEMLESCTRFRDTKNLNQYLYTDYAMTHDLGVDGVHSFRNFNSATDDKKIINAIQNPNKNSVIRSFVLNDTGDLHNSQVALQELSKLLPNKSKYEI